MALVDELRSLDRFTGSDPKAAEEAFVQLSDRIERFLWKYLASLVPLEQDREDVILTVLEKLYARRGEFQVRDLGKWWAYVAITGKRCAYDKLGVARNEILTDELPERETNLIGNIAHLSYYRQLLYRAADELWLGIDANLPESLRREKLLTAQFCYVHGAPWQEVAELVSPGRTLKREVLDEWLSDGGVLSDLAYHQLYIENEALACTLLGKDEPLETPELDRISRAAQAESGIAPDGWTWPEVRVVIWRYRNGLLTEKMLQVDKRLNKAVIDSAIQKCSPKMPFSARAEHLRTTLLERRSRVDPFASPGLWKRLVFQYESAHELPHKQILERLQPAAKAVGFALTPAMLNGWLSGGRLIEQLASHAKKRSLMA